MTMMLKMKIAVEDEEVVDLKGMRVEADIEHADGRLVRFRAGSGDDVVHAHALVEGDVDLKTLNLEINGQRAHVIGGLDLMRESIDEMRELRPRRDRYHVSMRHRF